MVAITVKKSEKAKPPADLPPTLESEMAPSPHRKNQWQPPGWSTILIGFEGATKSKTPRLVDFYCELSETGGASDIYIENYVYPSKFFAPSPARAFWRSLRKFDPKIFLLGALQLSQKKEKAALFPFLAKSR